MIFNIQAKPISLSDEDMKTTIISLESKLSGNHQKKKRQAKSIMKEI